MKEVLLGCERAAGQESESTTSVMNVLNRWRFCLRRWGLWRFGLPSATIMATTAVGGCRCGAGT